MKNAKNLERKSSADRIMCFLSLYCNPLPQEFEQDRLDSPYSTNSSHGRYYSGITQYNLLQWGHKSARSHFFLQNLTLTKRRLSLHCH